MEKRVNIQQSQPDMYKAMFALSAAVSKSKLSLIQKHLIKVRASQLNSCAYCINMHTKEALQVGETQQRLFVLSAWKEADLFTEEEQAILALTEEVTLIHQGGVSEKTYQEASKYFSPETISEIIMSIVLINGWNRIAVSTHLPLD
ncbi:MAG: carboxymuconolactone decarboxylase family protein [Chitinophagaceae bacterium]|nr:MAG: carboxymuconolactone decarboxylase family protein [Chitinophagaceae bacterium]